MLNGLKFKIFRLQRNRKVQMITLQNQSMYVENFLSETYSVNKYW